MEDLAQPALENVMNDRVRLHPSKFKNMYRNWMENVRDWHFKAAVVGTQDPGLVR